MHTIFQQYLSKGPRALYCVAVHELDDARVEAVWRWDNPKSADSRRMECRSKERALAFARQKVEEMVARGYDKRAEPLAMRAAAPSSSAAHECVAEAVAMHTLASSPPRTAETESLATVLERRRRDAAWSLE